MNSSCGIHGWGFALPRRRLAGEATAAAWERPAPPGARAIAGPDEDAFTLGLQAALQVKLHTYQRGCNHICLIINGCLGLVN